MITGVWVGFEEDRTLGRNETGTRAAAPIWLEYMKKVTEKTPIQSFEKVPGIVSVVVV